MKLPIYLDYQATTPVDPRVLEAMLPYFSDRFGNPSSRSHELGWAAEAAVEKARKQVARLIGAEPSEVVFTSGATESINLAIIGAAESLLSQGRHIITTAVEHQAVRGPCEYLESRGFRVTVLSVDASGRVTPDQVKYAITPETILVSIILANNEIGTLNPVREIGELTRSYGVLLHADACQAAGKIPLDVQALNVDLLSISGHKLYGPKGVGALYVRRKNPRVHLIARNHGGGQERGLRSGTLNVPCIVGFGVAAEIALSALESEAPRLRRLGSRLREGILREVPDAVLHGHPEYRLLDCVSVGFPNVDAQALMASTRELAVSSGSACLSGIQEPSHVLRAIGVTEEVARGTIRMSVGRPTTEEEIDFAVSKLAESVRAYRALQETICDEKSDDSAQDTTPEYR